MDLVEAERLARHLMNRHNVPKHWGFMFDFEEKADGVCHYGIERITIEPRVVNRGYAAVKGVLLHEIAHALTPGHKHDKVWEAKLISLIREHTFGV